MSSALSDEAKRGLPADLSEKAEAARIADQLTQFDGLALDNEPERRRLARWIAAHFTPKG